jgi:TonB family protein
MTNPSAQAGDKLLWIAAGVVALMGATWLVVEAPWSAQEPATLETMPTAAPATQAPAEPRPASVASAPPASDPLRMANMALEAGMLIEPPEYSAWTLFGRIAAGEPDNAQARAGLEQVATDLLQRAGTALEQGRFDDADTIAATILERFPEHEGALALAAEVVLATTPPPEPPAEPVAAEPERTLALAAARPEPVDPVPDLSESFRSAMAQNAVLRPAGTSAVDLVTEMLAIAPDHELTLAARDMVVTEMLDRSAQSIEARDTRAAQTWIDAAAPLADPALVERAQERLTRHLIEIETERILPASDLTAVHVAPAEFPRTALNRGIEGWVEIEFLVSTEGETEDVTVVDASHDRYFREESIAAVDDWRFEPVVFMGRTIPKRVYTRLEFVLD